MMPRTSHHDFNVQMQIHGPNDFPQILYGIDQDKDLQSISLKPGHEYNIELHPYGQMSTGSFMDMSIEKRQCRLMHETFGDATHPIYTKANCLYDCYVKQAYQTCHCIPWDFVNKVSEAEECDIFGRTCFFNRFENLTHTGDRNCLHCQDECDWIKYRRRTIKTESIELTKEIGESDFCNNYICVNPETR